MVNGWLPYQDIACRMWARSAFYQSGGAFGFRDQIQDAAAVVLLRPGLTRAQILLHVQRRTGKRRGEVIDRLLREYGAEIASTA